MFQVDMNTFILALVNLGTVVSIYVKITNRLTAIEVSQDHMSKEIEFMVNNIPS